LVAATKITAFKEELTLYSDWYKGKTKSDLESAQRIFAAYGASFGGNYDEHWNSCINDEEAEKFDAAKMKLISSLKDPAIKNKLWDFVEPALRHQLRVMEIKYQGVVISTFEYVRDYFGITYDIEKAREWYLKDTTTGQFAYQDYLGREHAARKVTALIERCIFKHAIFSISEVKSWIKKTETWLQETTGDNYSASKKYWE
jgi:hypothetical protein